jgi:hypothetical protein
MFAIEKYEDILTHLNDGFLYRNPGKFSVRMFGILFAPKYTRITREEILPRLSYLNDRSGKEIDFFCMGYTHHERYKHKPRDLENIKINTKEGVEYWQYSDIVFNSIRAEFVNQTRWTYSGETDLLLINAIFDFEDETIFIDYSKVIWLVLDRVLKDNPNLSIGNLFEKICTFADNTVAKNPINSISYSEGFKALGHALVDNLTEDIKKLLINLFKSADHFQVVDIEKKDVPLQVVPK